MSQTKLKWSFHFVTGDQICWNEWDAIQDSCFRLYDDKKTWSEAQSLCRTEKATLAKLNSEDKNYFVFLQLVKPVNPSSNPVWIGLSRDTENNFHWTDGTVVEYTNWGPGLPDNSPGNNQNCTKMNVYSGLWENEEFDFTHPFVCGRGEENEYITCKKFLKFRWKFGQEFRTLCWN